MNSILITNTYETLWDTAKLQFIENCVLAFCENNKSNTDFDHWPRSISTCRIQANYGYTANTRK